MGTVTLGNIDSVAGTYVVVVDRDGAVIVDESMDLTEYLAFVENHSDLEVMNIKVNMERHLEVWLWETTDSINEQLYE